MLSNIAGAILAIRSLWIPAQVVTSQASGFCNSCAYPGANLIGSTIGVYCLNDDVTEFGYNYSMINLNNCVGNNAGALVGFPLGNFSQSCGYCNISHPGTLQLNCYCYAMDGSLKYTSVDLNPVMTNNNGNLECYGHQGNMTLAAPGKD